MRKVTLIGCGKKKLPHLAKAKDLYIGQLFKFSRGYAERSTPNSWAILSAKYGLLLPDDLIAPYDITLTTMSKEQRANWGALVLSKILTTFPESSFQIIAGSAYTEPLIKLSANILFPNLPIGKKLKALKDALR